MAGVMVAAAVASLVLLPRLPRLPSGQAAGGVVVAGDRKSVV